jgi:hypothetical protein
VPWILVGLPSTPFELLIGYLFKLYLGTLV